MFYWMYPRLKSTDLVDPCLLDHLSTSFPLSLILSRLQFASQWITEIPKISDFIPKIGQSFQTLFSGKFSVSFAKNLGSEISVYFWSSFDHRNFGKVDTPGKSKGQKFSANALPFLKDKKIFFIFGHIFIQLDSNGSTYTRVYTV